MIGLILGVLMGLLELVPNAHPQILALTLLPLLKLGFLDNVLFVTALLTISLYLHALGHTYHPVPQSLLASAEPAQKMAYEGLGWWATEIQLEAVPMGLLAAFLFTPLVYALPIKKLLLPISLVLALLAVLRSSNRFAALLVLGLATGVGLLAQNLGHEGLNPLLTGLFTLPPMLHLLHQRQSLPLPAQTTTQPAEHPEIDPVDTVLGIGAALLPGISASSLAYLRTTETTEPWNYLAITAPQHNAAGMAALLLLAISGSPHSGLAVALFGQAPWMPATYTYLVMGGSLILLLPLGAWITTQLEQPYIRLVQNLPQKLLALTVLPIALYTVHHHAGTYGFILAGAACAIALLQKQLQVPNQILLQALTIPVIMAIA